MMTIIFCIIGLVLVVILWPKLQAMLGYLTFFPVFAGIGVLVVALIYLVAK